MLHINDLTYRIEGRLILDKATAGIPSGHKVGLVGRNGTGKTTLLRIVAGEIHPDDGSLTTAKGDRIGYVQQEAPGGPVSLIDWVLEADTERARLLRRCLRRSDNRCEGCQKESGREPCEHGSFRITPRS